MTITEKGKIKGLFPWRTLVQGKDTLLVPVMGVDQVHQSWCKIDLVGRPWLVCTSGLLYSCYENVREHNQLSPDGASVVPLVSWRLNLPAKMKTTYFCHQGTPAFSDLDYRVQFLFQTSQVSIPQPA